jgi:hypothetical protein
MDEAKRKIVVLLCMHRSGSSLTANVLQKLGMSLGPFELIGAAPSNPYGHFESIPFHSLNRKIQEWAFGFADDVPEDPEVLARFVATQGAWPEGKTVPEEWVGEAKQIVHTLAESGPVSGFKDPRTVLVWPFWRRVFAAVKGIEVTPVSLLRSPHEIAMSLCTRSQGAMPYWNAMDVVGAHLTRMKEVALSGGDSSLIVRFGTSHFTRDLRRLSDALGLKWDEAVFKGVYDRSCVHHLPAIVPHPAQDALEAVSGGEWADLDPKANAARLAKDARAYEATMHRQLVDTQKELGKTMVAFQQNLAHLAEAGVIARGLEARAARAETALEDVQKAFNLAKHCVEQSEKNLARTMECLVSTQERLVSAEQMLAHTQGVLAHTEVHVGQLQQHLEVQQQRVEALQNRNEEILNRHQEIVNRNNELEQSLLRVGPLEEALELSNKRGEADRARLAETEERITRMQEASIERDDQHRLALDREQTLWRETIELRGRLDRIESHVVIGAALRGRRQMKQIWLKFRHKGPSGAERTTRIDRPY